MLNNIVTRRPWSERWVIPNNRGTGLQAISSLHRGVRRARESVELLISSGFSGEVYVQFQPFCSISIARVNSDDLRPFANLLNKLESDIYRQLRHHREINETVAGNRYYQLLHSDLNNRIERIFIDFLADRNIRTAERLMGNRNGQARNNSILRHLEQLGQSIAEPIADVGLTISSIYLRGINNVLVINPFSQEIRFSSGSFFSDFIINSWSPSHFRMETGISWQWDDNFRSSFEAAVEQNNEGNALMVRNDNVININRHATTRLGFGMRFSNQSRGIEEIKAAVMVQQWMRGRGR